MSFCLVSNGYKPKNSPNIDQEIECVNRARAKNKKIRHSIVEGFLNLYLYENKEKIKAKAMVMSLGLRSATLYLPFYNLIKEVSWSCPIVNSGKDSITIKNVDK